MQTKRCTRLPGMTLAIMHMLTGRNQTRVHPTPCPSRTQTCHMPYARSTNRTRVNRWLLGIGLGLTVGLLTVPPGDTEDTARALRCSLATLKGRYLFGGIVTLLPPAFGMTQGQSLLAVAGYHIFNGDGTGTDIVTTTINGAIDRENFETAISYTVNADCTGTYTVSDGTSFGLFIAPDGEELIVIGTEPGFVLVQGPNKRVSRK